MERRTKTHNRGRSSLCGDRYTREKNIDEDYNSDDDSSSYDSDTLYTSDSDSDSGSSYSTSHRYTKRRKNKNKNQKQTNSEFELQPPTKVSKMRSYVVMILMMLVTIFIMFVWQSIISIFIAFLLGNIVALIGNWRIIDAMAGVIDSRNIKSETDGSARCLENQSHSSKSRIEDDNEKHAKRSHSSETQSRAKMALGGNDHDLSNLQPMGESVGTSLTLANGEDKFVDDNRNSLIRNNRSWDLNYGYDDVEQLDISSAKRLGQDFYRKRNNRMIRASESDPLISVAHYATDVLYDAVGKWIKSAVLRRRYSSSR